MIITLFYYQSIKTSSEDSKILFVYIWEHQKVPNPHKWEGNVSRLLLFAYSIPCMITCLI